MHLSWFNSFKSVQHGTAGLISPDQSRPVCTVLCVMGALIRGWITALESLTFLQVLRSPVIAHKQERQEHCKHAKVQVHGWGAMKPCEMVDGKGAGRTHHQGSKMAEIHLVCSENKQGYKMWRVTEEMVLGGLQAVWVAVLFTVFPQRGIMVEWLGHSCSHQRDLYFLNIKFI